MKYEVRLVATARVSALMTVEAESQDAAEADAIQQAREGGALWGYDGLDSDESIELGE